MDFTNKCLYIIDDMELEDGRGRGEERDKERSKKMNKIKKRRIRKEM
jgi:hypothetical protein